jgi:hypothetical protein
MSRTYQEVIAKINSQEWQEQATLGTFSPKVIKEEIRLEVQLGILQQLTRIADALEDK